MFALLVPLLASLPGLIGKYFQQKNDILTAKNEAERQIELAKLSMAKEIATAQLNLNATIVQATSSLFKYFTFIMWFGPFMVGVVAPEFSKEIFNNLGGMPQWYVESCIAIMFTVWGISVSAPVINGIFSGLGDFFSARREYKVELTKAKAQDIVVTTVPATQAQIDEDKFYAVVRKGLGGSISPKTFTILQEALKKGTSK
jgi:hypothetical protein